MYMIFMVFSVVFGVPMLILDVVFFTLLLVLNCPIFLCYPRLFFFYYGVSTVVYLSSQGVPSDVPI